MKTYIKTVKTLFCLSLIFIVSSWSIDNIKPINALTEDNAIRDEASAQQILNGVYY